MPEVELGATMWINEYMTPWDIYSHGITEVLAAKRTPYQDMQIVSTGAYGKALVLDGLWQSCTGDEFLYHEPLVHVPFVMHGAPKRVLVLGGGEGATAREALKWKSIERVVMVDIDGDVVEACREHLPEMHQGAFEDPRTELVIGDALKYLDDSGAPGGAKFDVIISDLSDPIEDGPSFPLFTREYFERCRKALAPGGVLVVQGGPVAVNELHRHARLNNTVASVFGWASSYVSIVSTYGSPWGFVVACEQEKSRTPDADAVDALLADMTAGGLRMFDGRAMLGMLQPPKHIRDALMTHTEPFTMAEPPKFFGQGVAGKS